jgi:type VI secretion system (T6SS) baseplate-like injector VgrG
MPDSNRFLGKYRGRVVDNDDPRRLARVRAEVPDVLGREWSTWALPCLPFAGEGFGHVNLPAVGAGVWIEFEQGDASHPIWSGAWFGRPDELPPDARAANTQPVVIQTRAGDKVVLFDRGGILLQSGGASIRIDGGSIRLEDGNGGRVSITNGQVDVNGQIFPGRV